jgi:hypothetical protein
MPRLPILTKTLKQLYSLAGNNCSFPGCTVTFFSEDDTVNSSDISHIEAAEEGGPRYNPNSDDEYRRSYPNLILLCPTHNRVIDSNPEKVYCRSYSENEKRA